MSLLYAYTYMYVHMYICLFVYLFIYFNRKQFHPSFNQTDSSLPSGKSSFQGLLSGPKTAELDITLSSIKVRM